MVNKTQIKRAVKKVVPLVRERQFRRLNARLEAVARMLPPTSVAGSQILPNREALLSALPAGGVVAEVGVAEGDFSSRILNVCAPDKLILIDLWQSDHRAHYDADGYGQVRQRFAPNIERGEVVLDRGFSWEQLAAYAPNTFDWVYVDAAHDYQSVKKDLTAAAAVVKAGGYICGHDYQKQTGFGSRMGVVEAVNEFVADHGLTFAYLTLDHDSNWSYGLRLPG